MFLRRNMQRCVSLKEDNKSNSLNPSEQGFRPGRRRSLSMNNMGDDLSTCEKSDAPDMGKIQDGKKVTEVVQDSFHGFRHGRRRSLSMHNVSEELPTYEKTCSLNLSKIRGGKRVIKVVQDSFHGFRQGRRRSVSMNNISDELSKYEKTGSLHRDKVRDREEEIDVAHLPVQGFRHSRRKSLSMNNIRDELSTFETPASPRADKIGSEENVFKGFHDSVRSFRHSRRRSLSMNNLSDDLSTYEKSGSLHTGGKRIIKVVRNSVRESINSFKLRNKKERSLTLGSGSKKHMCIITKDYVKTGNYPYYLATSDEDNGESSEITTFMPNMETFSQRGRNLLLCDKLNTLKSRITKLEKDNEQLKLRAGEINATLNETLESWEGQSYRTKLLQIKLGEYLNQWDDVTELQQNEMMKMKDEINYTLERIECVEYRFLERTAEIEEDLQNCGINISNLETEQEEQGTESLLDMDVKVLLSKAIRLLVNVFILIIFIISTLKKYVEKTGFVTNKSRVIVSFITIISIILVYRSA